MDATQADKKEQNIIKDLYKEGFEELILSIDTRTAAGKVSICIIQGCKQKDYTNGNALKAWKHLYDKYIYNSAPTLLKINRKLAKSRLKKYTKDPEEWITELEELSNRLEDMGSIMSDEDLVIHILNILSSEYELQVEKRKGRLIKMINC